MIPTRCNLIGSILGPLLLGISLAIGPSAMAADAAIDKLIAEIRRAAGVAVGLTTGAADGGPSSSSCVLSFADTADAEKTYTFPIAAASASTTTTGVVWSCNSGPCIVPCKKQSTDGIAAPCDAPITSVQLPARRPMHAPLLASLFVKLRQFCASPTRK